jgi:hypothetical protein
VVGLSGWRRKETEKGRVFAFRVASYAK